MENYISTTLMRYIYIPDAFYNRSYCFIITCVCVCVWVVCAHEFRYPQSAENSIGSPGTVAAHDCQFPCLDAGNQT